MTLQTSAHRFSLALALVLAGTGILVLSGCGDSANTRYEYPEKIGNRVYQPGDKRPDSVFGSEGLDIFGTKSKGGGEEGGGGGLGVNSYLWRASLDTVSFMPIASADPFGGVIITDWYAPPETPSERFKLNVFIMGRALRADGIKVAAFRQAKDEAGNWVDRTVEAKVTTDLENAILTRARKMRIATQGEKK